MFKNISLRAQLTIVTTLILTIVTIVLTITSVFNANRSLVDPIYSMMTVDTIDGYPATSSGVSTALPLQMAEGLVIDTYGLDARDKESLEVVPDFLFDAQVIATAADTFKLSATAYMFIIIVLGAWLVYYVLGKVLNPVKQLSEEMELINEKRLSERLVGFDTSHELKELSHSFNMMLDRLDRAFESQKRFSSDAAHELKTPLTVLKTRLDVLELEDKIEKEDYVRFMEVTKKQTERMIQLVDNLFVLSAQKDYQLDDEVFLDTIFVDILEDLCVQIEAKHLTVTYEPCEVTLQSNKIMLVHALSNLVQNAIRYNHRHGRIKIETRVSETTCVIEIIDTGIGIPADVAEHIFDPFYCVDSSRSRKSGGAGLGLAITKDVISRHSGKIEYEPNPSGGSVFKVTLPIK